MPGDNLHDYNPVIKPPHGFPCRRFDYVGDIRALCRYGDGGTLPVAEGQNGIFTGIFDDFVFVIPQNCRSKMA